jgi:hypothetical protein
MGFNPTAVRTAVTEIGSGGGGASAPTDPREFQPKDAESQTVEQSSRRPRAVLCGSYRRDIRSLVRTYEELSAAGLRVLAPSGLDFVAEMNGFVSNHDENEIPPEAFEGLRLNCIRAADMVWLHAPDGYVGLGGALEVGFAKAAGIPVFAAETPSDVALRSLVTILPLDQAIASTITGETGNPGGSVLPDQEHDSAIARERRNESTSEQEIMLLITEEIGELARQNPGQRQQPSDDS